MEAVMPGASPNRRATRHDFPVRAPNTIGNYALKFIPKDVWEAARKRALTEGVSIRWVLLTALKQFAEGSLNIQVRKNG